MQKVTAQIPSRNSSLRSQKLVSRERKPVSEERAKEREKYLWRKAKEKAKLEERERRDN